MPGIEIRWRKASPGRGGRPLSQDIIVEAGKSSPRILTFWGWTWEAYCRLSLEGNVVVIQMVLLKMI